MRCTHAAPAMSRCFFFVSLVHRALAPSYAPLARSTRSSPLALTATQPRPLRPSPPALPPRRSLRHGPSAIGRRRAWTQRVSRAAAAHSNDNRGGTNEAGRERLRNKAGHEDDAGSLNLAARRLCAFVWLLSLSHAYAAAGQARTVVPSVQVGQPQDKQQQGQQSQRSTTQQQQQQSSPTTSTQQQQQLQQSGGVSRTDSGNDFAMSIADGAASPTTLHGGGNGQAAAAAQQAQQQQANSQQQQPSPHQGHEKNVHEGLLMSPTPSPPKIETVPTAFKWVHGGSEVYVTGSFNNWQGKILMYPNEDGEFTLLIDIPPGTHHYKYIVDSEWRLDEDAPTIQIASVWNNVVEVKRPVFEYTPAAFADSDDDEDDRKQKAAYSQRAPLSNDYVNDPPKLPPHLTEILLNQTQPQDPAMLPVPQHVQLNHVYLMSPAQTDPSILVTGITQRFKPNPHTKITHKFVTTVYYAPRVSAAGSGMWQASTGTNSPNGAAGPYAPFPTSAVAGAGSPQIRPQQAAS